MNSDLELFLYRGRLQLATTGALYSDGDKYIPAIAVAAYYKAKLPAVTDVLMLGSGLGSMVNVLHKRGHRPAYTLVEHDETVLRWAMEFLQRYPGLSLKPVCDDAMAFIAADKHAYGLIFVDVFNGRVVPGFATSAAFLQNCRSRLAANGCLALNYIVNDKQEWEQVRSTFAGVFSQYDVIDLGLNRVLVSHKDP